MTSSTLTAATPEPVGISMLVRPAIGFVLSNVVLVALLMTFSVA